MERKDYYDKHYKKEGILNLLTKRKIVHSPGASKEALINLLVQHEKSSGGAKKIDWFYFLKRIFAFGVIASALGFIVDLEDALIIVRNSPYNILGKTIEQDAQNPNAIKLLLLTTTVKDQNTSIEKLRQGLVQIDSVFKCGFSITKLNIFQSNAYREQSQNIFPVEDLSFYIDSSQIEKYAFQSVEFGYALRKSSISMNLPLWEETTLAISDFVALVFKNTLMEHYRGNGDFNSAKIFDYLRKKRSESKITKLLAYDLNSKIGNVYSVEKFVQHYDFDKIIQHKIENSIFSLALADSINNNKRNFPAFESAIMDALINEDAEVTPDFYLTPKQKKAFQLIELGLNPDQYSARELEAIFGDQQQFKLETPTLNININKYSLQLGQLEQAAGELSKRSERHLIEAVDSVFLQLATEHPDLQLHIDYLWFRNYFDLDGEAVLQMMRTKFGQHSIVEYLNFDKLRYDQPTEAFASLNRAIEKELFLWNKVSYLFEAVAYGIELNEIKYARAQLEALFKIIETNSLALNAKEILTALDYLSTILVYFETGKQDIQPLEALYQKDSDGLLTKLIFNYHVLNNDLEKAIAYRSKLETLDRISEDYALELAAELDEILNFYTNGLVNTKPALNVWKRSGYSPGFFKQILHIWTKGIEDYLAHQKDYDMTNYTGYQKELLNEVLYFQALINSKAVAGDFTTYLKRIGLKEDFLQHSHCKSLNWYLGQLIRPSNEKITRKKFPCFFNQLDNLLVARQNSRTCEALVESFTRELFSMQRTKEEPNKIVNPIKVRIDNSLDILWQNAILSLSASIFDDMGCGEAYFQLLYARGFISEE